jgi:hypothetical protein
MAMLNNQRVILISKHVPHHSQQHKLLDHISSWQRQGTRLYERGHCFDSPKSSHAGLAPSQETRGHSPDAWERKGNRRDSTVNTQHIPSYTHSMEHVILQNSIQRYLDNSNYVFPPIITHISIYIYSTL